MFENQVACIVHRDKFRHFCAYTYVCIGLQILYRDQPGLKSQIMLGGRPKVWSDNSQRFQLNELDSHELDMTSELRHFRCCYVKANKVSKNEKWQIQKLWRGRRGGGRQCISAVDRTLSQMHIMNYRFTRFMRGKGDLVKKKFRGKYGEVAPPPPPLNSPLKTKVHRNQSKFAHATWSYRTRQTCVFFGTQ